MRILKVWVVVTAGSDGNRSVLTLIMTLDSIKYLFMENKSVT